MPNWCSTSLEIETGTERLAKKVSDKIESWCHECGVENGFGDNWLGNIAVNSNAFPKYSDVSCRGTLEDEYVLMVKQDDGGYRRMSYPVDNAVVYEDAEADDARVEVVDQYVVIRETYEFPIAGEWTRDRREFSKCEIRIHVPAGSIAQGEYDIS